MFTQNAILLFQCGFNFSCSHVLFLFPLETNTLSYKLLVKIFSPGSGGFWFHVSTPILLLLLLFFYFNIFIVQGRRRNKAK